MAFLIPTLDELHDRFTADYRSRFPSDNVSRFSDNGKRIRVLAGAVLSAMHQINVAYKDLFPDTAAGDSLDHLGIVWGVTRKAATPARKSDGLTVFGTVGSSVAVGDLLTHVSGLIFQVNAAATIQSGDTSVLVDVVGVSTGKATKLSAGETLTFSSPPTGIQNEAELAVDLDEDGTDQEDDGAYRTRLLDQIAKPGMGGNANDYKTWGLEETGVASVYVYPLRRGRGSVDIAALHTGRGSVRVLTSAEKTSLESRYADERPVGMASFRVLDVTTTAKETEATITLKPGSQYAMDWTDSEAVTVTTWTASTRTLVVNKVNDMVKGDRLVVDVSGTDDDDGKVHTIESITGTTLVLTEALATAPSGGESVYPAGPVTKPVRDAILAHYDSLGPAVGDDGTGEWDDELDPNRLLSIILGVDGVRNAVVVTPSATFTPSDPAYPSDTSVQLVIPGQVMVRKT